jgi:hypothetical protein
VLLECCALVGPVPALGNKLPVVAVSVKPVVGINIISKFINTINRIANSYNHYY